MSQKESNLSLKLDKGRRQNMYWANAIMCAAIKSNGSVCCQRGYLFNDPLLLTLVMLRSYKTNNLAT